LLGSDLVGYPDLVELDAALQDQGGRPFEGGEYVFVTPPQVYAGLLKDPDFKASNQFRAPEKIWRGEVGMLGGFRVIRSNSFQISDLQNLRVYVVAPGGQLDPLQQSRKIGWKFAFKSVITNQNWIRRVRSSGANSITN
jgi:hypothetical protein